MVSSVVIGRYVFLALGLTTACTVLYTCITDGSPFRSELLTPYSLPPLSFFACERYGWNYVEPGDMSNGDEMSSLQFTCFESVQHSVTTSEAPLRFTMGLAQVDECYSDRLLCQRHRHRGKLAARLRKLIAG